MRCFTLPGGCGSGAEKGYGKYLCGIGRNYVGMVPEEIHEDECDRALLKIIFPPVLIKTAGAVRRGLF